ncbi:MAG: tetrahydrofolate dehydrogenase/cyclohydrolase catalytic domain-containing protein [Bacteroidales bacterium]
MQLIDGKATSSKIKEELKAEVAKIIDDEQRAPHLVAVLVGNDPASETYVGSKEKNAKKLGFTSSVYRLEQDTTEKELLKTVDFLNNDPEVDGFIVQLPLPDHIDADKGARRARAHRRLSCSDHSGQARSKEWLRAIGSSRGVLLLCGRPLLPVDTTSRYPIEHA